ncbi:DUF1990 domain-containing protein [Streptomyces sp. DSM 42041]|uniref:DUF1990 domain-containing protein n=1 Tax=Streptomyces hazeniae TaxID=3075538 RepID=A0ABU2NWV4_9ACTN|nr:DUF1990 domain-containing protein [Streptomyces sp. DSM 42041]MDT0381477.1 DUF1990 domain-containing protein [Streptomyces sp. DSM 42041]
MDGDFTYADVGATATDRQPEGFSRLWVRTRIGEGDADFRRAAGAVSGWRMHRAMGVRIDADAESAVEGARVRVGLGIGPLRLHAPCRVVWTLDERRRAGWAYGTLAGHPQCGEEAFVVTRDGSGTVWLTVLAFSRPAAWWTRAAGGLVPVFQRRYADRCGTVLRRLVREGGRAGG